MWANKLFRSLRFRVTVAVLLPLLVLLLALSYGQYVSYRTLLLQNVQLSATNTGDIIKASLQDAMFANNLSMVQQIMDAIVDERGVQGLFVLDKQGQVALTAANSATGDTFGVSSATCQDCHGQSQVRWNESMVLTAHRVQVFRNANAIENGPGCQQCHGSQSAITGVLIVDFPMAPVQAQLATYRGHSLLFSAGSIAIVLLVVNLVTSRMVLGRLERFVKEIGRVNKGDLDAQVVDERADEIGELARSFNQMTEGLRGKAALEASLQQHTQQLQAQTNRLSTLNVIAATVSQSLNLKEVLDGALGKVLELLDLKAGWIVLHNPQTEELTMATALGMPAEVALAHVQCAWDQGTCAQVLDIGRARVFRGVTEHPCPTAEYFAKEGLVFRACVPIASKDRVLGVMSLVGRTSDDPASLSEGTLEMLEAIGLQIGIAVENARLYEELRREEVLRRRLLERLMTVQEEEHRRIALELHDQTGQSLTSLIIKLSGLAEAKSLAEVHAHIQELRDIIAQILQEVHDLALELRPSVLDDLGLLPALRHLRKTYEDTFHIRVDLEAFGFETKRLSPDVETALFRIVQEALTNVVKHAQAQSVSVLLEHLGSSVKLIVEDDGVGFDVAGVTALNPPEKLGLYGMRERALVLGGTFTVESTPGTGTAIFVEIPLPEGAKSDGQDTPVGS